MAGNPDHSRSTFWLRSGPEIHLPEKLLDAFGESAAHVAQGRHPGREAQGRFQGGGRLVRFDTVKPSAASRMWGKRYKVDARVIELALRESKSVIRRKNGVADHRDPAWFHLREQRNRRFQRGWWKTCAASCPKIPTVRRAKLHRGLAKAACGLSIPVIISDSFGRPWREGLTEVAIGVAGMKAIHDYRGPPRSSRISVAGSLDAVADELACAAGLLSGKLTPHPVCYHSGIPVSVRTRRRPFADSSRETGFVSLGGCCGASRWRCRNWKTFLLWNGRTSKRGSRPRFATLSTWC